MNKRSLYNLINEAQVISFDIFDTLLIRPYVHPTDVFRHIENVYHRPCFCVRRIEAEQNAKFAHPNLKDVTLDMIYQEIDDDFKDMKQTEMEWEEMILRPNPEVQKLYHYAQKQGKRIIITSDMYLPNHFLSQLLGKNGYKGWEKLYVSAEINARKSNGELFQYILSDLQISPQQILHIGDNINSDYYVPQELKIPSIRYETPFMQFIKQNKRYSNIKLNSSLFSSLGGSIMFSVIVYDWFLKKCGIRSQSDNYWFDLGYMYAGPTAYGYTRFIEHEAIRNKIDSLLFVARDGYLLQKIFKTFNHDLANCYVYAPRVLNHLCRLDYDRKKARQAQFIIDFYAQQNDELREKYENIANPHEFIQQNKSLFNPLAQKQLKIYRNYLFKTISKKGKYALVDTMTGQFSSQKIIEEALGEKILGFYWGVYQRDFMNKYQYCAFAGEHMEHDFVPPEYFYTSKWNFMEFIITSPEYPIKNINNDGTPIYSDVSDNCEKRRVALYPDIVRGALAFADDIQNWFKGADIYLTSQDIVAWVNLYLEKPTASDIKQMQNIKFSEDSAHQIWLPLLSSELGLKDFVTHPKKSYATLKKTLWRTPLQSLFLCFYRPLSVRTHHFKQFNIVFFPHLRKRYGTFSLSFSDTCYFNIIIGRKNGMV